MAKGTLSVLSVHLAQAMVITGKPPHRAFLAKVGNLATSQVLSHANSVLWTHSLQAVGLPCARLVRMAQAVKKVLPLAL
jgi:hypothetical protein